ncbi:MAG: hypothetical protein IKI45_11795 [Oscillospiraceae bacterium]|nr:hypothetical protein [Oscillospiraceae bacterium]
MTDKEFKKLHRADLIEIIYEYQRREKAMQEEIASLRAQLEERSLKLKDAGSIAEAVIRLNALFETAQKTADDYVEQVRLQCEAAKQAAVGANNAVGADNADEEQANAGKADAEPADADSGTAADPAHT